MLLNMRPKLCDCLLQMYLIGIVWACYKYLKQHDSRQARIRVYDRETALNPEDTEVSQSASLSSMKELA